MSVQLYVDALDQYLYYFEQNVEAVSRILGSLAVTRPYVAISLF